MDRPAKTIAPEETQETKAPEASQEASQNANPEASQETTEKEQKTVLQPLEGVAAVAALVAAGTAIRGLHVVQATYSRRERDGHEYFTLTTDKLVPQYIVDMESGEVKKQEKHSFRVSAISLRAALRTQEVFSELTGILRDMPKAMERILPGSVLDVVVRDIPKDGEIVNYYTGETRVAAHDTIAVDVIGAKASTAAANLAARSLDMLLSNYYAQ